MSNKQQNAKFMLHKMSIFTLLTVILFSCSTSNKVASNSFLQKRKYTKGWHFKLGSPKDKLAVNNQLNKKEDEITPPIIVSENVNKKSLINIKQKKNIKLIAESNIKINSECDKITFKNGDEENVIVEEIGDNYIKYKKCSGSGPVYKINKNEVFMIVYSNGEKEIIKSKEDDVKTNDNQQSKSINESVDVVGILGFTSGIIGLLIFPLLFSSLAVILGIISIIINKKNKTWGIISFIVGVLGFALIILLFNMSL